MTALRRLTAVGSALALAGAVHQQVNLRSLRVPAATPPDVTEPVSVLVPARDEAHRITPTVHSLLAQRGVPDLEILVLDDGSTDGTADVVRAASAGDPRVRVPARRAPPAGPAGQPPRLRPAGGRGRRPGPVARRPRRRAGPRGGGGFGRVPPGGRVGPPVPVPRQLADGLLPRLLQPLQ